MNGPSSYIPQKENDSGWGTGLLFGGITLVLVLIAFFALNYFNILFLSELYPKAFGWLPHKSSFQTNVLTKATPNIKTDTSFDPIFKSQTAQIEGTIVKVDKGSIEVEAQGHKGKFLLTSSVAVYRSEKGNSKMQLTGGAENVTTGSASIILQVINNQFKVQSITY